MVRGGAGSRSNVGEEGTTTTTNSSSDDGGGAAGERRVLRSKYLRFKNRISDERDDMSKVDSDKFKSIIEEVDNLHQLVQKPREQVADAEALFDITTTLVSSVKAHGNDGVTPADFVSCLLRDFGQQGGGSTSSRDDNTSLIRWKDVGHVVSHVFRSVPGCCTMIGPMNTELKQRKNVAQRKRTRPTENERPEEIDASANEEKTDTDKNMATMFDILRKNRKVKLENLILNRNSFAQTVENLFALSFLVKDGRAEIRIEDKCQLVLPRNAPSASAILSGEASYSHFIFRFDFSDWKLMMTTVEVGEELMPHRNLVHESSNVQPDSEPEDEAQTALPTTPIRKFSRNRGLVMQEQDVVQDSPESGDAPAGGPAAIRRGKRKL